MAETTSRPIDQAAARRAMIDSQLRTSGVTSPWVVSRMRTVAREDFVPASAKGVAYVDRAIPLGDGKYLAAPLFHGSLLQEAAPQLGESAIVVDGGSGYLSALLEPLVAEMTVLTPEEALSAKGGKKADLILIDGAVEEIPAAVAKKLADEGRLVTGLVSGGVTRLARGRKAGANAVALMPLAEMGIPRLPQFDRAKSWSF